MSHNIYIKLYKSFQKYYVIFKLKHWKFLKNARFKLLELSQGKNNKKDFYRKTEVVLFNK